ncbi:hypothetical protein FH972_010873 [Carpinus fangiana]|uniref:Uncharacterized protein n=1 Tax=Carpinus fangiana TaxID=176857 RepID=A0A660KRF5_9ROSI|nr:hypothetical protein FH972_010873 [Carpinus fangiana]
METPGRSLRRPTGSLPRSDPTTNLLTPMGPKGPASGLWICLMLGPQWVQRDLFGTCIFFAGRRRH